MVIYIIEYLLARLEAVPNPSNLIGLVIQYIEIFRTHTYVTDLKGLTGYGID